MDWEDIFNLTEVEDYYFGRANVGSLKLLLALERLGLETDFTKSSISESAYVYTWCEGDDEDEERVKIRVSDHRLPEHYSGYSADFEAWLSHPWYGSDGDIWDALVWAASRCGIVVPDWVVEEGRRSDEARREEEAEAEEELDLWMERFNELYRDRAASYDAARWWVEKIQGDPEEAALSLVVDDRPLGVEQFEHIEYLFSAVGSPALWDAMRRAMQQLEREADEDGIDWDDRQTERRFLELVAESPDLRVQKATLGRLRR